MLPVSWGQACKCLFAYIKNPVYAAHGNPTCNLLEDDGVILAVFVAKEGPYGY